MSFRLQQAAIASELKKAGFQADAANRLASILGNSVQEVVGGQVTSDLTPKAMRKITPQTRKFHLTNVDFREGSPDFRKKSVAPSELRSAPKQGSSVRTTRSPQETDSSYSVSQGQFTDIKSTSDGVSVGLRVKNTGQFVTQDSTSGSLIGRNIKVGSNGGANGSVRLSLQESGSDVFIKLEVDEDALVAAAEEAVALPATPSTDPAEEPGCTTSGDCPDGQVCVDGECVDQCPDVACTSDADCGEGCICNDSRCTSEECGHEDPCPEGKICLDGRCVECIIDGQCPDGFECVNNQCVPKTADPPPPGNCASYDCSGQTCGADCVCIGGLCYPKDEVYYCCYDEEPVPGQALPETHCQLGPCVDQNGAESQALVSSGPFDEYEQCCVAGCGCRHKCVNGGCVVDPSGAYTSNVECLQKCDDGGALGSCCEAYPPNTSVNPSNCVVRKPAEGPCSMYRSGCVSVERDSSGVIVVSRSWTSGLDCEQCAKTAEGACCLPDGSCATLCEGDCNDQGGTWLGAAWSDCTTQRSLPRTIDFACDDCNGELDCGCAGHEKCEGRNCVPCGDESFAIDSTALWQTGVNVVAGDTVDVYFRTCNSDGATVPANDRDVNCRVGVGGADSLISSSGSFVAAADGQIFLRAAVPGVSGIVCLSVTPASPDCATLDLKIKFDWSATNQTDLDIAVETLGSKVGYDCSGNNNSAYLTWSQDDVGRDAIKSEDVVLRLSQALADGAWADSLDVELSAHWYQGLIDGIAEATVSVVCVATGDVIDSWTIANLPVDGKCSENVIASVEVTSGGYVTVRENPLP